MRRRRHVILSSCPACTWSTQSPRVFHVASLGAERQAFKRCLWTRTLWITCWWKRWVRWDLLLRSCLCTTASFRRRVRRWRLPVPFCLAVWKACKRSCLRSARFTHMRGSGARVGCKIATQKWIMSVSISETALMQTSRLPRSRPRGGRGHPSAPRPLLVFFPLGRCAPAFRVRFQGSRL